MIVFHVADDVAVRCPDGHVEHGVVHEVLPRVVWVSLDTVVVDVPFDPADSRLQPWVVS